MRLTAALRARAEAWLADDPDPETRAELADLVARAETDDEAGAALADRFDGRLEFGTAGLRGAVAAGPNRMNRAVVIRAAAGLAAYLLDAGQSGRVVIGYDARHKSDVFAQRHRGGDARRRTRAARAAAAAADTGAGVRDPAPRLCRRRDGDGLAQPAARQRLQGLPRRRQPDRAAGRRRDLGPHRRGRRGRRRASRELAGRSSTRTSSTPTWPP